MYARISAIFLLHVPGICSHGQWSKWHINYLLNFFQLCFFYQVRHHHGLMTMMLVFDEFQLQKLRDKLSKEQNWTCPWEPCLFFFLGSYSLRKMLGLIYEGGREHYSLYIYREVEIWGETEKVGNTTEMGKLINATFFSIFIWSYLLLLLFLLNWWLRN